LYCIILYRIISYDYDASLYRIISYDYDASLCFHPLASSCSFFLSHVWSLSPPLYTYIYIYYRSLLISLLLIRLHSLSRRSISFDLLVSLLQIRPHSLSHPLHPDSFPPSPSPLLFLPPHPLLANCPLPSLSSSSASSHHVV
jgi:hypothetical protein